MSTPQNFRSAFNGFNREDVVHYLEYINTKHNNQISQLSAENQELRTALEQKPCEDQTELVESLQTQCAELTQQLDAQKQANAGYLKMLQTPGGAAATMGDGQAPDGTPQANYEPLLTGGGEPTIAEMSA